MARAAWAKFACLAGQTVQVRQIDVSANFYPLEAADG